MKDRRMIGLVVGLIFIVWGLVQMVFPSISKPMYTEPEPEQTTAVTTVAPASGDEGTPTVDVSVTEDGEYSAPAEVAEYIRLYEHLPSNYITKSEAESLGWQSSAGNLWDVAPGKSIGGDVFGNREGLLPEKVSYHECDVNYSGGLRGAERLVYGDNGSIYYTSDHYSSFEQLY